MKLFQSGTASIKAITPIICYFQYISICLTMLNNGMENESSL